MLPEAWPIIDGSASFRSPYAPVRASRDHPDGIVSDTTELTQQPAEKAISVLLEKHGDQIYGLGLRLCADPERAEDLVQETFVRALKSWDGFDGRSKPSTWLYTIASRACQRLERRRAGEPRHMKPLEQLLPSGETTVVDIPADGDTPLEWTQRSEVIAAVRRAIDTLPLDFRLPVVLKEMEDVSIDEVAAVLGVKPATVKTRLHRARLLMRKELTRPLPQRPSHQAGPPSEGCLDLLWAKQEAMDRGVEFPIPPEHLCERCQSTFATLDLASDVCHALGDVELPEEVRAAIRERMTG